jgi:hypothetical protein
MPDPKVQHAFVSYVHEDADAVSRLVSVLRAASIPVWKDTEGLGSSHHVGYAISSPRGGLSPGVRGRGQDPAEVLLEGFRVELAV